MTNLREAAQMALDALEHGLPTIEDFGDKEQIQIQHKAIAALYEAFRAALAQPEQATTNNGRYLTGYKAQPEPPCKTGSQCVGGKCERCAVQPEQEPVAWWHDMGDVVDLNVSGRGTPLYFSPPQREWQGLTDEEIEDACWTEVDQRLRSFARAIEHKLREKNV